jgi:hypothetical protein
MASELLIRPGYNDHEVVADLLAPGGAATLLPGRSAPIDRLVVDAHIAKRRPQFAAAAAAAGVPFVVDPLTHFWQGELRHSDSWASLPYGRDEELTPQALAHPLAREELIAQVIDCELDLGATLVVPPYVYARTPEDAWFSRQLELIDATANRLRRLGLRLPMFVVLVVGHQGFAAPTAWGKGIDRFARLARDCGAAAIGLSLSPAKPNDGYNKVAATFATTARVKQVSGLPTFAWRQGIFGASLTAAVADGYETGIATSEACDIPAALAARRPRDKRSKGGNPPGIYIDVLGRSVQAKVGRVLLDSAIRSKVMCDDERCCPDGPSSTKARPREHAVRMRARNLATLDALPHISWRLHQVGKDASAGSTLATQANQILENAGLTERLPTQGLESVARVARHLLSEAQAADAA